MARNLVLLPVILGSWAAQTNRQVPPLPPSFTLQTYVGRDLDPRVLPRDLEVQFEGWLVRSWPETTFGHGPPEKVLAWTSGKVRYAVLARQCIHASLNQDSVFVAFYNSRSKLLGSGSFETGRGYGDAEVVMDTELGSVLRLRFAPVWEQGTVDSDKNRFADIGLDGDQPVLIRVLFPDGSLDRPGFDTWAPGPVKQVLRSGSVCQELAVLAWLASPQLNPDIQATDEMANEDAREFANLRSDPEVDREIDALATSPSPAVRQVAKSYKWWFDFAAKHYR